MGEECVLFHNAASQQVFLNNPFDNFGSGVAIPYPVGIHYQDRTGSTNPQAVGFSAEKIVRILIRRAIESQFLEAALEVVPGF
jgi:hypothetical protein